MLTVSLSGKKIKSVILSVILILILLGTALFLFYIREKDKVFLSDKNDVLSFLETLGYDTESISEEEIIIPKIWNETYENYNLLQKEQGFDLHYMRGKTAVKYTAISGDNEITILVSDGVLIGGDVFCYENREQGAIRNAQCAIIFSKR